MPAYFALGFIALVGIIYLLRGFSRVDPALLATVPALLAIARGGGRPGPARRRRQDRPGDDGGEPGLSAAGGAGRRGASWRESASPRAGARASTRPISRSAWIMTPGSVDGQVKQGRFSGRRLGELSRAELLLLLDEVRREDREAVAVLEAYLDRIHGPEWRSEGEAAGPRAGGARRLGAGRPAAPCRARRRLPCSG